MTPTLGHLDREGMKMKIRQTTAVPTMTDKATSSVVTIKDNNA
ncbi:hypothetical protein PJI16_03715 [Nitrospira sp. MA-1]|nr:hypothetical protein [Nitrospira sp. MA-1]